jgi:transcriptional regulator with XRE-family HTH domain
MTPAELIRDSRRRAGLSQAEVARRLGRTQAAVAQLERRGSNPTVGTLDAVLRATGHRLELTASKDLSSIDETQLAERIRLTPAERLRAFKASSDSIERLRLTASRSLGQDA